jgi:hypothetical protein
MAQMMEQWKCWLRTRRRRFVGGASVAFTQVEQRFFFSLLQQTTIYMALPTMRNPAEQKWVPGISIAANGLEESNSTFASFMYPLNVAKCRVPSAAASVLRMGIRVERVEDDAGPADLLRSPGESVQEDELQAQKVSVGDAPGPMQLHKLGTSVEFHLPLQLEPCE